MSWKMDCIKGVSYWKVFLKHTNYTQGIHTGLDNCLSWVLTLFLLISILSLHSLPLTDPLSTGPHQLAFHFLCQSALVYATFLLTHNLIELQSSICDIPGSYPAPVTLI